MKHKFLTTQELRAGDVLLGRIDNAANRHLKKMEEVTKSKYSHAAIYLGNGEVAEATLSGVEITPLQQSLEYFDHLAVFSRDDTWNEKNLAELRAFIEAAIKAKAQYNPRALYKFAAKKEEHEGTLYEQLSAFFDGDLEAPSADKTCYFCSELVVACFIKVGILTDSAAVVFKPDKYAPKDLAIDPTYGEFKGFLTARENYKISKDDDFFLFEDIEYNE